VIGLALAACAPDIAEPNSAQHSQHLPLSVQDVVSGYVHRVEMSRFAIGPIIDSREDGITQKLIGKQGVFATNPRTGFVAAIPNATSSLAAKPALMDADAHNAAVKSYFVSCGLPERQIGWVNVHGTVHTDVDDRSKYVGDGYSTVLSRSIDGIFVPESFAWARLSTDQQVIAESVYWPDVPVRVLNEAKELATVAGTPDYLTKLGADLASPPGSVAIHHSVGFANSITFTVTYDVAIRGSSGASRHFDGNGLAVTVPSDIAPVPNSPRL